MKPVRDFDERLHQLIVSALAEDIGEGDHSTLAVIPASERGKAVLKIKQEGILAGMEVAQKIFLLRDPTAVFQAQKADGDTMKPGDTAFIIESFAPVILACERLVLNCMQRMSGIATLTHQYVKAIHGFSSKILDTRKTTPGFRLLEKEAVRIGGGMNHRFGLFDMIMLKDNHIDFCGGITKALEMADDYIQKYNPSLKIEVEVRNLDEVKELLASGKAHRIMLDNFNPPLLKQALEIIQNEIKTQGNEGIDQPGSRHKIETQAGEETSGLIVQKKIETEASGGINLENIRDYAATGVDFISIGALIHQARSLDLSLKALD